MKRNHQLNKNTRQKKMKYKKSINQNNKKLRVDFLKRFKNRKNRMFKKCHFNKNSNKKRKKMK